MGGIHGWEWNVPERLKHGWVKIRRTCVARQLREIPEKPLVSQSLRRYINRPQKLEPSKTT
jgi:hypothetical protein